MVKMMMVGCMGAMVKVIQCQEEKINGCVSLTTVHREKASLVIEIIMTSMMIMMIIMMTIVMMMMYIS